MTNTLTSQPERVVDIFLRYLLAEGAQVVFGVPGGLLHAFFEAVETEKIPPARRGSSRLPIE